MSARAKMIARGESTEDAAREDAQIISDQVERMARIIRQLLDFARRRTAKKTQQDLRSIVKTTLGLLAPIAASHKVRLVERSDAGARAVIRLWRRASSG